MDGIISREKSEDDDDGDKPAEIVRRRETEEMDEEIREPIPTLPEARISGVRWYWWSHRFTVLSSVGAVDPRGFSRVLPPFSWEYGVVSQSFRFVIDETGYGNSHNKPPAVTSMISHLISTCPAHLRSCARPSRFGPTGVPRHRYDKISR